MPRPASAAVRILKFDADSPTDNTLQRMQQKLHASTSIEAMRRSLTIADRITDFTSAGRTVYVKESDGSLRELVIS